MGALPNRLHDDSPSTKKAPAKAKAPIEKCQPRPWKELHQQAAGGTNFDRGTGWYPVHHSVRAELLRLSSGALCHALVHEFLANCGRLWSGKGEIPTETQAILLEELAVLYRVTRHAVNEVLAYLIARRMAKVSRLAGGRIVVRLQVRDWSGIQDDYPTWKAKQVVELPTDEDEEESEDDGTLPPVAEGRVAITRKPETVRAGHRLCRAIKVGVREMEIAVSPDSVDIQVSAAVISGRLVVEAIGQSQKAVESKIDAKREESTRSSRHSGSIDPGFAKSSPSSAPISRGEEIAKLFDRPCLKSCHRTLSGDSKYFLLASKAIGDTPHDFLVKAAVDRASRAIKPHQVPQICAQIARDWEKSKVIDKPKYEPVDQSQIKPWNPFWYKEEQERKAKAKKESEK